MAAKWRWKLSDELADLVDWVATSTALMRDTQRAELADLLKKDEPRALGFAKNCAFNLGMWESKFGARAVLEGDASGWGHLRLGTAWYVWRLRAMFHLYQMQVAQGEPVHHYDMQGSAMRGLAAAIALREEKLIDWGGSLLVQELSHPTGFFSDWDDTPFYPFMAWLFARWKHLKVDTGKPPLENLGVYQPVVDSWDSDEALAGALVKACDYHCLRAAKFPDRFTEFWYSPFRVFPGEILAIQRVRFEETGRWVAIKHPLLASALGTVPASLADLTDPLLEEFKSRVLQQEQTEGSNLPVR
jgi:hypothetical protein